jgi:hypothetical protein
MPLVSATANGVVKILLDNIIPLFELIENIDSGNGSHCTANVIRELVTYQVGMSDSMALTLWEKLKE